MFSAAPFERRVWTNYPNTPKWLLNVLPLHKKTVLLMIILIILFDPCLCFIAVVSRSHYPIESFWNTYSIVDPKVDYRLAIVTLTSGTKYNMFNICTQVAAQHTPHTHTHTVWKAFNKERKYNVEPYLFLTPFLDAFHFHRYWEQLYGTRAVLQKKAGWGPWGFNREPAYLLEARSDVGVESGKLQAMITQVVTGEGLARCDCNPYQSQSGQNDDIWVISKLRILDNITIYAHTII